MVQLLRSGKSCQIDQANADRQRNNAEKPQLLVTELGQFFRQATDERRGQRIGQPLHYKYKSDRQKQHAHWRRSSISSQARQASLLALPVPMPQLAHRPRLHC